jgi:hypothetical protein
MGGTCNIQRGDETWVQSFGLKVLGEETTWKILA